MNMKSLDVSPIDIRDYAMSIGWRLVPQALNDGLFVLNSPDGDYKQLIFPKDESAFNYDELGWNTIHKLSDLTNLSAFKLLEEIREVNDDIISLRYFSESKSVNSLSFQEAFQSIEGTKELILSAASSVVNPVLYHKRLSRTEPTELLKKTRFRHTEEGSFILKISCPVEFNGNAGIDLFGNSHNKPFARETFELINRSAFEILNAVESNSVDQFINSQMEAEKPFVTYNFCEGLLGLFDEERELPFDLKFNWSRTSLGKLSPPTLPSTVRFPFSIRPKIDQIKNYLRPVNSELTDTFFGTVESLNGNIDNDGKRSGEVRLSLIMESAIVNARVMLNSEYYELADKAHMNAGLLVKIKGRLLPGKQIRLLDEISDFSIVDK